MKLDKVLITGSAGFLGRHFVEELEASGTDVDRCDLVTGQSAGNFFRLSGGGYDLCIHCAYHVGGRARIDSDREALIMNLELDSALFRWAALTKTRVLYISSSAVYPTILQTRSWPAWGRLFESAWGVSSSSPAKADGDYGYAKCVGEKMADNARQCGVPVHVVRPFSGYGADQDKAYPFPACVARARSKQDPFEVWGDPDSLRDWIHVSDVVRGALAVVEADYQAPVNLCTGIGTSFAKLAKLCMEAAGYEAPIQANKDAPQGVFARVGDPTRMLQFYTPQVTIEQGVKEAVCGH